MKVVVGSMNPVKIEAARLAFEKVWPQEAWEVEGMKTDSGVATQPMSDEESIKGARNRARALLTNAEADFVVGIEGGVQKIGDAWFGCGWMVVIRVEDRVESVGSSAKLQLPPKVADRLLRGEELGLVADSVFGTQNAKQNDGYFGLATKGAVTRTSAYVDGLIFALSKFLHPELFEKD